MLFAILFNICFYILPKVQRVHLLRTFFGGDAALLSFFVNFNTCVTNKNRNNDSRLKNIVITCVCGENVSDN